MLGGFCVGAGTVLLLSVLGVAVGMTVSARPAIAGPLWAALSLLTGFFVAGLAAARATNQPARAGALIQGTLVWVLGIGTMLALVASGVTGGVTGLFQGLPLLAPGAIVSSLATAARAPGDDAAALDDLRARVARVRDDPARVAAEVDAFLEQHPARGTAADPAAAASRDTRLGAWITFGALMITLAVSLAGALMATPDDRPTWGA